MFNNGRSFFFDVDAGSGTVDAPPAYAADDPNAGRIPFVVAAASTGLSPGGASPTLFAIDATTGALVRLPTPAGGGQLVTVGPLGVSVPLLTTLSIAPDGVAYATMARYQYGFPNPGFVNTLYRVDLATGAAPHS